MAEYKLRSWVKWAAVVVGVAVVAALGYLAMQLIGGGSSAVEEAEEEHIYVDGILADDYTIVYDTIRSGQTLSKLLEQYGVGIMAANRIAAMPDSLFSIRNFRAGQPYTALLTQDSIAPHLDYLIYQKSIAEFVIMSFLNDSVGVEIYRKPVVQQRRVATAHIKSSLWNSMSDADMPPALAVILEDMFGWSVDFFALHDGDKFTVIYDDRSIDSVRINPGQVYGAVFRANGKEFFAIPFNQNGKIEWWDEKGNSLEKVFMKVPVRFTRISSRYGTRVHPIYHTTKVHYGVDYAAPAGTPIMAAADGTVTDRRWDSYGGGNIVKIRHSGGIVSGYMHMSRFANIAPGQHVSQGQVIGYVGSTGSATGPHLHYALWVNGKYTDPQKFTSLPVAPLEKRNMEAFNVIKEKIIKELRGEQPDSLVVTSADLVRR